MNPRSNKQDNINKLPLISFSIPVYNEEDNLDQLYERLVKTSALMEGKCRTEFVYSDNSSQDGTWAKLIELSEKDERVRAIRFSKNFGFQRSILANYMHTRGDAVMQVDADLQDPPELLQEFFEKWKQGYHVVYGVRAKRQEGFLINTFRKIGYWIIDKISEYPIPCNAGDFRLIDRKVVEALKKYKTPNPYLRGIIASMGFKQLGIPYERSARNAGHSKFSLSHLIRLGLTGVFNHSVVPLRMATFSGVFLLFMSLLGTVYYISLKIFNPDLPLGLASIHILVLFGIGFQSLLLGVLGEYLLRIYVSLRNEPVAIIEQSLNIEADELKL